ncbi:MAG: hypothetical protein IT366_22290 [Candidatus Hydrogenedentes bacterium]|nr:hypothetical protein [Candidatus Hydrogenedentota bacterium]
MTHKSFALFTTLVVALCSQAAEQTVVIGENAVVAEPDQVHFSKYEDSATIQVLKGPEPLPSKAIKSVRAVIGKSDYSHHFNIKKSSSGPATITLSPKEGTAQSGTFTLVISTKQGDALVAIDMPLDQIPGTLDDKAKKEGKTVEELKAEMGLSHEGKRETTTVRMPKTQYVGSLFSLQMPTIPGRDFTWKFDDQVVLQGVDKNWLKIVIEKAGEHRIDMEMRENGAVITTWSGVLTAINYPDMRLQVRQGNSLPLRGARGYTSYQWTVDGKNSGDEMDFKHTFKEPGEHTVQCVSRGPISGDPGEFFVQTWKVTVKARA